MVNNMAIDKMKENEFSKITYSNYDKLANIFADSIVKAIVKLYPFLSDIVSNNIGYKRDLYIAIKNELELYLKKSSSASTKKFIKVAANPIAGLVTGFLKNNWQDIVEFAIDLIPLPGVKPVGKLILKAVVKSGAAAAQKNLEQAYGNLDFKRREYILETLIDIGKRTQKNQFSPSAYQKILNDKGYKGGDLSQGAYDVKTPAFKKELEQAKKDNPEKFKLPFSYLEDKDVQERKKGKKFDFYNPGGKKEESSEVISEPETASASTSKKFIKTSQTTTKITDQDVAQRVAMIEKLLENWNEDAIKQSMIKISNRTDITDEQKQQLISAQVKQYAQAIKPLQSYMDSLRKL